MRLAALHAWPALPIRPVSAFLTTRSMSDAPRIRYGSEPPSSSTTFFRLRPAISATAAPARSEPVSETPWMRSSPISVSICSLVAKMLTYAPSGRPASRNSRSISSADSGHCGACLSTMALPSIRLGAANRATW